MINEGRPNLIIYEYIIVKNLFIIQRYFAKLMEMMNIFYGKLYIIRDTLYIKKSSKQYDRNSNEENSKLTKKAIVYIWYTFSCNIWHSYFTSGLSDLCIYYRRLYLHVSVCAIHTGKSSGAQVTRGARWPREFPTPAWFYACILFALTGAARAGETYEAEILHE